MSRYPTIRQSGEWDRESHNHRTLNPALDKEYIGIFFRLKNEIGVRAVRAGLDELLERLGEERSVFDDSIPGETVLYARGEYGVKDLALLNTYAEMMRQYVVSFDTVRAPKEATPYFFFLDNGWVRRTITENYGLGKDSSE